LGNIKISFLIGFTLILNNFFLYFLIAKIRFRFFNEIGGTKVSTDNYLLNEKII